MQLLHLQIYLQMPSKRISAVCVFAHEGLCSIDNDDGVQVKEEGIIDNVGWQRNTTKVTLRKADW